MKYEITAVINNILTIITTMVTIYMARKTKKWCLITINLKYNNMISVS